MLALPMSAFLATKPAALTGEIWMDPGVPPGQPSPYGSLRPCGESHMGTLTWDGLLMTISEDVAGSGYYDGKWVASLNKGIVTANGWYTLDVKIGTLSGQLTIRVLGSKLTIVSGTADLTNLHGTGRIEVIEGSFGLGYTYSLDVHFDP